MKTMLSLLFAAALSRVKGLDPDQPDGLSKVTLAL